MKIEKESTTTEIDEKALSPEEVKEIKAAHTAFWADQLPYLEKQLAYEKVVTELEELYMRRLFAKSKITEILGNKASSAPVKPLQKV